MAAGAAVRLGNLDGHDTEVEQLVDQGVRDLTRFVHLADMGAHLRIGERPDVGSEKVLILGQSAQRRGSVGSFEHRLPMVSLRIVSCRSARYTHG